MDQRTTIPTLAGLRQEAAAAARAMLAGWVDDGSYTPGQAQQLQPEVLTFIERFGQAERVSTISAERVGTLVTHGRTMLEHRRTRADEGDTKAAHDVAALDIALRAIEQVADKRLPGWSAEEINAAHLFGPNTPSISGSLNFARYGSGAGHEGSTKRRLPLPPKDSLTASAVKKLYPSAMHREIDSHFEALREVAHDAQGELHTVDSDGLALEGGFYSMPSTPPALYVTKSAFDNALKPRLDALAEAHEQARQNRASARQKPTGVKLENHTGFSIALKGNPGTSFGRIMQAKLKTALVNAEKKNAARDAEGNFTLAFEADGSKFTLKAQHHPVRDDWMMIDNRSLEDFEQWRRAEHAASGSKGSRYWQDQRAKENEQGTARG